MSSVRTYKLATRSLSCSSATPIKPLLCQPPYLAPRSMVLSFPKSGSTKRRVRCQTAYTSTTSNELNTDGFTHGFTVPQTTKYTYVRMALVLSFFLSTANAVEGLYTPARRHKKSALATPIRALILLAPKGTCFVRSTPDRPDELAATFSNAFLNDTSPSGDIIQGSTNRLSTKETALYLLPSKRTGFATLLITMYAEVCTGE